VLSNGRKYTCNLKEVNGKLCFYFKKAYHPITEYISDHADELVEEGGKIISRPFKG